MPHRSYRITPSASRHSMPKLTSYSRYENHDVLALHTFQKSSGEVHSSVPCTCCTGTPVGA
eukprot:4475905-Prymnesium_polylepis.1